ncbi:epsin-2-like isoform X2 [Anneissia japonica]|uniref:epsin-2-like isoform X2 n=1 Tax=Anneissia japonica TaxID=1529436 RepID=UPI001425616A|nr:epsin-2-like isoform X2 [Anneissia japonica]
MATMRSIKNVAKNYSPAQVKVREATSNDPWGPSSSVMSEIADLSYNVVAFTEIMTLLWKRLSDHGKNWRHVYKSLVVLEYIIKTGSERVAQQCKENIFAINTLKDFQFLDRDGKDQGMNVREKSKNLVALLKDDERLKSERTRALKAKERFAQSSQGIGSDTKPSVAGTESSSSSSPTSNGGDSHTRPAHSEIEQARPATAGEEDLQLQLALAMSREEAEQQTKQTRSDDIRLQMALNESLEETKTQPTQPTQPTLLNLAEPAPAPVKPDPWGMPTTGTTAVASDPWGAPPAPSSQHAIEPWGATSKPAMPDPWAVPAPAPAKPNVAANDPWSKTPAPVPIQNDPWGMVTPAAATQSSSVPPGSQVDWGFNSTPTASDPDHEFDLLRSNTVPQAQPVGAFDMSLLNDAVPQPQQMLNPSKSSVAKTQKKPEDFLGENSSLVNLDSLIVGKTERSNPTAEVRNPFVFGAAPSVAAPVSNPFQQQQAPRPTLNQMRAQPMMTAPAPAFGMPQQPVMMGASTGLPPPLIPMGQPSMQMQPTNQATNPFLL